MPITKAQLYNISAFIEGEINFLPEAEKQALLKRYIENDFESTTTSDGDELQLIHSGIHEIQQLHRLRLTQAEAAAAQCFAKLQLVMMSLELEKEPNLASEKLKTRQEELRQALSLNCTNPAYLLISAYYFEKNSKRFSSEGINKHINFFENTLSDKGKFDYLTRVNVFESLVVILRQEEHRAIMGENLAWIRQTHTQLTQEHQQLPSRFRQRLHDYKRVLYFTAPLFASFIPITIWTLQSSYQLSAVYRGILENPAIRRVAMMHFNELDKALKPEQLALLRTTQQMILPEDLENLEAREAFIGWLRTATGTLFFGGVLVVVLLACAAAIYGVNYLNKANHPKPEPLPEFFSPSPEEPEEEEEKEGESLTPRSH